MRRIQGLPRWFISAIALLLAVGAGLFGLPRLLQPEPSRSGTADTLDWAAALAGLPDEGFERPSGAWDLELPADHGAHPNTRTETWTISAQLRDDRGDELGLQLALFRLAIISPDVPETASAWAPRELYLGHVALLDVPRGRAAGESRMNRAVLGLAGHDAARKKVWLDHWSLEYGNGPDGSQLRLDTAIGGAKMQLLFTPVKAAVPANPDGGGAPFRGFSITRMSVQGLVGAGGDRRPVSGLAWLDHLWGDVPLPVGPIAWDRLQLHLDDGTDLSVFRAHRRDGGGTVTLEGYLVGPHGDVEGLASASLDMDATRAWRRDAAGALYPLDWQLSADDVRLRVAPLVDDQLHEFVTPFWSGTVAAQGNLRGKEVTGWGTLQLTGYPDQ